MLPKLYLYDLETSYLCLVDFKEYGLEGDQLRKAFMKFHVCPIFTEKFFLLQKPRSLVWLNLAANRKLIVELV